MDIGSFLTSIASGGVTGLIGTGINLWATHKKKQQSQNHELAMANKDMELFKLEAESADKISARNANVKEEAQAVALMETSLKSDKATYSSGAIRALEALIEKSPKWAWAGVLCLTGLISVDIARGFIRPLLTTLLVGYACYLSVEDETARGAVIYMGTTSLLWWFGTRSTNKNIK